MLLHGLDRLARQIIGIWRSRYDGKGKKLVKQRGIAHRRLHLLRDAARIPLMSVHRHFFWDLRLDIDQPVPQLRPPIAHRRDAVQLRDGIAHFVGRQHRRCTPARRKNPLGFRRHRFGGSRQTAMLVLIPLG